MITIISGTNRHGSTTRKIAGTVSNAYSKLAVENDLLDLATLPLEIASPEAYAEKPAALAKFSAAILKADGLVIVTPEYNGGVPGILKLFIDMLPFPESFERRPVCFVGLAAGMWGALRPVEQLQAIFGYRNAHIFPERVFIPGVGKMLDGEGVFSNADIEDRLQTQAAGFVSFVEKIGGKQLRP